MTKICALLLSFVIIISMSACSSTGENSPDKNNDETIENSISDVSTELDSEECQHVYKEEIYKEAGYGVDGIKIKVCTICKEIDEYIAIPALSEIFELKVTNKHTYTQGSKGYVVFDIEIKNISDKKIESISGKLSIMPPDCILDLLCDFEDLSLEPYATTVISSQGYSFDLDTSFDEVEKKVYDTEFENIKFYFTSSDVVVEE